MLKLLKALHQYKFFLAIAATIVLTSVISTTALNFLGNDSEANQDILGIGDDEDTVNVSASVNSCEIEITVYPEKRIPRTGNWGTLLTVQIFSGGNFIGSFQTNTSDQGTSLVNICDLGINLQEGTYTLRIRGFSHLYKVYPPVSGFGSYTSVIEFTGSGDVLFAGETSNVFDNKINSLDISTQIRAIYSADVKNDLNQDGGVNSLDFSNTITNFFLEGE